MDGARIYAQGAIREKGQAINYLRLSARIDAVASRVQTAVDMSGVTKSMCGVVKGMDKVLSGMNVEKISKAMDKFEKQVRSLLHLFSSHSRIPLPPLFTFIDLTPPLTSSPSHTHTLTHSHTHTYTHTHIHTIHKHTQHTYTHATLSPKVRGPGRPFGVHERSDVVDHGECHAGG